MFHQASNTGKSIPIAGLVDHAVHHTHAEVEIEVDNSPDPVQPEYDRDHQNDGGYNEKTGFKNPPGREKNYLRMRSRIGRRR